MKIWFDAHLPESVASWLTQEYGVRAEHIFRLGLAEAEDEEIFLRAREAGALILTKDSDFEGLLTRLGPPPQVLWLTIGNTSNERLREVLEAAWENITDLVNKGEPLIEIGTRAL